MNLLDVCKLSDEALPLLRSVRKGPHVILSTEQLDRARELDEAIFDLFPKLIALAKSAPKGCICHVRSFDGYYGSDHSEPCLAYLSAISALETPE